MLTVIQLKFSRGLKSRHFWDARLQAGVSLGILAGQKVLPRFCSSYGPRRLSVALVAQIVQVKSGNPDALGFRVFHNALYRKEIATLQFYFQTVPENDLGEIEGLRGTPACSIALFLHDRSY